MTIEEKIRESMLGWLQRDHEELDAVAVWAWEEELPGEGYCETCGPDPISVTVRYTNSKDESRYYLFYGHLTELIEAITRSEQRAT